VASSAAWRNTDSDILTIVELSLKVNIFTCLGRTWQQIRDTAIGNQISPILSLIAVSFKSFLWTQRFPRYDQPSAKVFMLRYVDNRILIIPRALHRDPAIRVLRDLNFYEDPVTLETVTDGKVLGCHVNPAAGTVAVILPTEDWQFLHPKAANTTSSHLSVYKGRLQLIRHQAYPDQLRGQQYQNLRDIYIGRRLPVLSSSRLKEPHAALCTLGKTCACSCCTQTNL